MISPLQREEHKRYVIFICRLQSSKIKTHSQSKAQTKGYVSTQSNKYQPEYLIILCVNKAASYIPLTLVESFVVT